MKRMLLLLSYDTQRTPRLVRRVAWSTLAWQCMGIMPDTNIPNAYCLRRMIGLSSPEDRAPVTLLG